MPVLRRNNRIHSIHLSFNQLKDDINGKIVLGVQNEIQEVEKAHKVYEMMIESNPYSIKDLLKIHGVMTFLTIEESGVFRKGEEGVFDENDNSAFIDLNLNM